MRVQSLPRESPLDTVLCGTAMILFFLSLLFSAFNHVALDIELSRPLLISSRLELIHSFVREKPDGKKEQADLPPLFGAISTRRPLRLSR